VHNEVKMIFFGAPGADGSTRSKRAEISPKRCTDKKNHLSQSRGGRDAKLRLAKRSDAAQGDGVWRQWSKEEGDLKGARFSKSLAYGFRKPAVNEANPRHP